MKLSLNAQILLAAVFGVAVGFFLFHLGPESSITVQTVYYCGIIGKIFVSLLKMILIPLVFTSITVGIANLRAHAQMQKVWRLSLLYYISTTALAVILGLFAVNLFKPGAHLQMAMFQDAINQPTLAESLTILQFIENFLANLFVNPIQAMANGMVLPTIMFALFLGIALIVAGDKAKTTLNLMNELFQLIMMIVNWIMKILPIGICALLIKLVATQDPSFFKSLGTFIAVVIGTTLFHGFITLPLLLITLGRFNLFTYYRGVSEALITAFSTSSSAATLPITTRCMEENLKVDKDVAGFVLPLGATINMDGTALYEAVAALFVANLAGIDLNLAQQCVVFFMAILASVGAPGIPSAGMVTMVMVLQSVGLPAEAIAILLPIDRLLDAVRTMVNVKGDTIGTIIVDRHTH
ncbi:MAG: dicarboxylate/amino acid:cation symporter [Candidatus Omnitrophica bacterium]|nr:dicarboxylate/amino acid:cation symporter [Candidatus Omnitrophota bacterium]